MSWAAAAVSTWKPTVFVRVLIGGIVLMIAVAAEATAVPVPRASAETNPDAAAVSCTGWSMRRVTDSKIVVTVTSR